MSARRRLREDAHARELQVSPRASSSWNSTGSRPPGAGRTRHRHRRGDSRPRSPARAGAASRSRRAARRRPSAEQARDDAAAQLAAATQEHAGAQQAIEALEATSTACAREVFYAREHRHGAAPCHPARRRPDRSRGGHAARQAGRRARRSAGVKPRPSRPSAPRRCRPTARRVPHWLTWPPRARRASSSSPHCAPSTRGASATIRDAGAGGRCGRSPSGVAARSWRRAAPSSATRPGLVLRAGRHGRVEPARCGGGLPRRRSPLRARRRGLPRRSAAVHPGGRPRAGGRRPVARARGRRRTLWFRGGDRAVGGRAGAGVGAPARALRPSPTW